MVIIMHKQIGAFDAKAKLSALLKAVERGQHYTITVRGRPVADLVPTTQMLPDVNQAIDNMLKIKKVKGVSKENLREWISEGRQ